MNDPAQVGHCVNCGAFAYAQSLCDPCSNKEPPEDEPKIWCRICEDCEVEVGGDVCEGCQEEAHRDGKCFDGCFVCEMGRDASDMADEKGCQAYTEWKESEL